MMVFDGVNDGITLGFLNTINWSCAYGVPRGTCPISPLFLELVPGAHEESGVFEYITPPLSGSQIITMSWYKRDGENGKGEVVFKYVEITRAS